MILTLITEPTLEPITIDEAKDQLRISRDNNTQDRLIWTLMVAARQYCEKYTNRAFMPQTWELVLDAWPTSTLEIPRPLLQSVSSIKYKDQAGAETTWPTTEYIVAIDSVPGRVALAAGKAWPGGSLYPAGAVRVRFVAGYASVDAVPYPIRLAILQCITHWYEHPEIVAVGHVAPEMPMTVRSLLSPYRVFMPECF